MQNSGEYNNKGTNSGTNSNEFFNFDADTIQVKPKAPTP